MANKDNSKDKNLICNFCGKSQDEVERMIIGPGVNICNEWHRAVPLAAG